MPAYNSLAIPQLADFIYGKCPHPVVLDNGMSIGGGTVYPELNFTLPSMHIDQSTMPEVSRQYQQMIESACQRAVELYAPGLVVEFELLPDLTLQPEWGAEVTAILKRALDDVQTQHGLKTALRVTPNDIREFASPPLMRQGEFVEKVLRSFEICADAGADFLAIESTGGKEVHDDAILNGDLTTSVFALGVLACRDMTWLWGRIVDIAAKHNSIAAGDTACGFANTAMALAEQKFIPQVWAAVIRVMSVPRGLVPFEQGALGPNKDCAYEGPYLKAITGCPISQEGAEAACAHFSSMGNISHTVADLWSNESVNNVKLLSGMAPTVSLEQLVYATRVMNTASAADKNTALMLRDLYADSDAGLDPQAYVLKPDVVLDLAAKIIAEPTPYLRTRRAALATLDCLNEAGADGKLKFSKVEQRWLDRLVNEAQALPEDEDQFIAQMIPQMDPEKILLAEYELA